MIPVYEKEEQHDCNKCVHKMRCNECMRIECMEDGIAYYAEHKDSKQGE